MFKLKRYSDNPILQPDPVLTWEAEGTFNPGVVKVGDKIKMLYRAIGERKSYISHFGLAESIDGLTFKRLSSVPVFGPHEDFDQWATEDPRITPIGEDFFITYVAVPERIMDHGQAVKRSLPLETSTALLKTKDFINYENLGVISPANSDNKDIVLFPRKINGRYAMLHRPNRWTKEWFLGPYEQAVDENLPCAPEKLPDIPGIWIAWSNDLKTWTDHQLLMHPSYASAAKIGPGLPPIETPDGWLIIYHHVERAGEKHDKFIYSVRAALIDLNDPTKFIAKLPYDILAPEATFETENGSSIVFPTGGFINGDTLYIYYGAADRYVGLATGSLSELLSALKDVAMNK